MKKWLKFIIPIISCFIIGLVASIIFGVLFFNYFMKDCRTDCGLAVMIVIAYIGLIFLCVIPLFLLIGTIIGGIIARAWKMFLIVFLTILAISFIAHFFYPFSPVRYYTNYALHYSDSVKLDKMLAEAKNYNFNCTLDCKLTYMDSSSLTFNEKEEKINKCIKDKGETLCNPKVKENCKKIMELNIRYGHEQTHTDELAYSCYRDINPEAIDMEVCKNLNKSKEAAKYCEKQAKTNLAVKEKDYSLCYDIQCEIDLAMRLEDINKCRSFSAEEISAYRKIYCYYSCGREYVDMELCNEVKGNKSEEYSTEWRLDDLYLYRACISMGYYNLAMESKDINYCNKIPDAALNPRFVVGFYLRNECIARLK